MYMYMYIDVSHIQCTHKQNTDTTINDKGSNEDMTLLEFYTDTESQHVPHENMFRKNTITSNGRCTCTYLTAIRTGNRL